MVASDLSASPAKPALSHIPHATSFATVVSATSGAASIDVQYLEPRARLFVLVVQRLVVTSAAAVQTEAVPARTAAGGSGFKRTYCHACTNVERFFKVIEPLVWAYRKCQGVQKMPGRSEDARAYRRCEGVQKMPGRSEDARAFRRCQGVTVTPGVAGLGRVMRRPHSVSAGGSEGRIALHLARPRGWQGRSAFPSCPPCPPPLPVSSRCAYLSPQKQQLQQKHQQQQQQKQFTQATATESFDSEPPDAEALSTTNREAGVSSGRESSAQGNSATGAAAVTGAAEAAGVASHAHAGDAQNAPAWFGLKQEERRSMAGAAPAGLPSLRVHGRAVGGCVGGAMQPAAAAAPAAGPAAAPAAAPTERAAVADVAVGGSARVQSRDWRGERADV
ncbi:unnamed protein product [Closterium sp. NIES-64]|nr:unnamed protein product [Closterium sp. NIES-64]